jgi:GNAT superfamily N-acetyltransferase
MALGPTFRIERATLDDAGGILGCLRAAFAAYRTQYTPAAYEDTVMTVESVRHRLETMTVLVARNDQNRIIGTVGAAAHGTEGHIRGMAVVPSFQGDGVADQLLEAIESELNAAGCSRVKLDTTAPLARAIRFYERHGYVRSDVVADFFGMSLYEYRKAL